MKRNGTGGKARDATTKLWRTKLKKQCCKWGPLHLNIYVERIKMLNWWRRAIHALQHNKNSVTTRIFSPIVVVRSLTIQKFEWRNAVNMNFRFALVHAHVLYHRYRILNSLRLFIRKSRTSYHVASGFEETALVWLTIRATFTKLKASPILLDFGSFFLIHKFHKWSAY